MVTSSKFCHPLSASSSPSSNPGASLGTVTALPLSLEDTGSDSSSSLGHPGFPLGCSVEVRVGGILDPACSGNSLAPPPIPCCQAAVPAALTSRQDRSKECPRCLLLALLRSSSPQSANLMSFPRNYGNRGHPRCLPGLCSHHASLHSDLFHVISLQLPRGLGPNSFFPEPHPLLPLPTPHPRPEQVTLHSLSLPSFKSCFIKDDFPGPDKEGPC